MARRLFSKPIHAKERNDQPSVNHGLSTAKPRSSHFYLGLVLKSNHLPLSAGAEPESQGHFLD